ncbi:MAG: glycerol-3-phosphate 1-O-acyltransferase PlsY [Verrucomicrobia bacterium]|nr:glycerol-3-phosphate 1-O-acyltransferase PlsY [Verrucomicrobiota bacterium]
MLIPLLIAALAGYLLGATPFGYLVARAYGINIFEHGSKSPGATNVKRVLGKKAGNTVFALDAVKGALAAGWPLAAAKLGLWALSADLCLSVSVLGLLCAVLGHSFSCFTRFKGGKGVATSAGGFVVLMPVVTLVALAVWLGTFYASRYVSLASILAAVAIPVAAFFLHEPALIIGLGALIGGFVIFLHRANIKRLLNGTENRFVKKPAETTPSSQS